MFLIFHLILDYKAKFPNLESQALDVYKEVLLIEFLYDSIEG